MTDKVQKIREEVEKLKSQLLRGACASQIAMDTRCKEGAYNEVLAIIDSLQKEPVSEGKDIFDSCLKSEEKFILPQKICGNINCENCPYSSACALGDIQACIIDKPVSEEFEDAADKYSQSIHSDYFNDMFDSHNIYDAVIYGAKWGKHQAEVEIQAQSMALAHGCPKESITEELEEAANAYISNENNYSHSRIDTFKAGAMWQKEQFEKNRLKHCNSITNEQAELEQGFIDQHLDKYRRMPTFLDAIEYGMRLQKAQMIKSVLDADKEVADEGKEE